MTILQKLKSKQNENDKYSPVKIAFLGDSITHGCFEVYEKKEDVFDCVFDIENTYHTRLKSKIELLFPNCPVTIINAGISGGTAPHGLDRIDRDIIKQTPDIAIVCFGLNDVHNGKNGINLYIDALMKIFNKLKENEIETIFMTPNMMCTYPVASSNKWIKQMQDKTVFLQNEGVMDLYMQKAIELCEEMNIVVCDCYADWKKFYLSGVDITQLLANSVNHPIREMHELFANRLFETIFLK